jgi:hypothetical protein
MVKAFPIVLTGDMPQAANNSGFMRHNAIRGCKACFIEQIDRKDIEYDVITQGRYHFDTVLLREEGIEIDLDRERAAFFKENAPAVTRIAPDLI